MKINLSTHIPKIQVKEKSNTVSLRLQSQEVKSTVYWSAIKGSPTDNQGFVDFISNNYFSQSAIQQLKNEILDEVSNSYFSKSAINQIVSNLQAEDSSIREEIRLIREEIQSLISDEMKDFSKIRIIENESQAIDQNTYYLIKR